MILTTTSSDAPTKPFSRSIVLVRPSTPAEAAVAPAVVPAISATAAATRNRLIPFAFDIVSPPSWK